MERRNFIAVLVALPALGLLAACGSDSTGDSLQTSDNTPTDGTVDASPGTVSTPSSDPVDTVVPESVAFDEVVLSYTTPGGFTTREFAFQSPPIAIVTGDGMLIQMGVTPAVFPGPLLPQHQTQTVSPAGIEALLAAADSAGLFTDIDYTTDDGLLIADAATATLTITADGATYSHEAYALGVGGGLGGGGTESTPERQRLADFLSALQIDPVSMIGADNLGTLATYEPDAYQLIAAPINDLSGFDPAPTIEVWPTDSGIDLSTATECVEVERSAVGGLFDAATQLTFFEQDGVTYQVTPRPAYPGSSC